MNEKTRQESAMNAATAAMLETVALRTSGMITTVAGIAHTSPALVAVSTCLAAHAAAQACGPAPYQLFLELVEQGLDDMKKGETLS